MRKFTTMLVGLLMFSVVGWSQDTIRHLIISELRFDQWTNAYVELTNMGDTPVDLSEFTYTCIRPLDSYLFEKIGDEIVQTSNNGFPQPQHSIDLDGMLEPGDSYLIMAVQDAMNNDVGGRPVQSLDILAVADTVIHRPDWNGGSQLTRTYPLIPEWEMWGFDSLNYHSTGVLNYDVFMSRPNREAAGLYWHSGDTISVLVDQALLALGANGQREIREVNVAGKIAPCWDYNMIRKFSIKEGQTDWTLATGLDAATSEWMLVPHRDGIGIMGRTTEGNHGNFTLDATSTVYDIDEANSTITVPWGTEKMDSIRLGLDLGLGMAWWYLENGNFEDSLSTICQDGDTLELYAAGNELQMKQYVIKVSDPAGNMVDVFAKHAINWPDPEADDYSPSDIPLVGGVPYWVKEYDGIIDSITEVGYATKVDSLLNLIEIAPNASWEIVWASGEESNEVNDGDIFRVTGGDGTTTKDYYIQVDDYMMSDNVDLKAITWPDNPYPFLEGWNGDTIPGFIETGLSYKITLPPGTTAVPALRAETADLNAKLSVDRAVSLSGGIPQRTTTFTITSESDTTVSTITVLFEVQVDDKYKQKFVGEPIFSKFGFRVWWGAGIMEICNPSEVSMDLSNYMIIRSNATNPADAIMEGMGNDSTAWLNRYLKYIPGYKWETYDQWQLKPRVATLDAAVSPDLDPGEVMLWYHPSTNPNKWSNTDEVMDDRNAIRMGSDAREAGVYDNPWGEPLGAGRYNEESIGHPNFPYSGNTAKGLYYIFKILNDSVKFHGKQANDPYDFELVDVFGSADNGPWIVGGNETADNNNWYFRRNPDIFQGVTTLGEGFDDWYTTAHKLRATDPLGDRNTFVKEFGQHTLNPVTIHLSTVSSLLYKVDIGYVGDLGITGIGSGETVEQFYGGLIMANENQSLAVYNGADGVMRDSSATVVEGDSLVVISADSVNSTTYLLSTVPLDDNAALTAADGSGLEIDITDPTGTIGGFTFGATIRSILDNVEKSDLAVLNVIDANDNLVPLSQLNNDTIPVDLIATTEHYFEVVAQSGKTIVYQLVPGSGGSDAYVLSNVYEVTQDPVKVIDLVEEGTAVQAFYNNVVPVTGATLQVKKISGQVREIGNLSTDDKLVVTSEDGSVSVVYDLNFIGELAAYVTSSMEKVAINQAAYTITLDEGSTVADLIAALTASEGATFFIEDADGNEKTSGELAATDIVVVLSGDGINSVEYTLVLEKVEAIFGAFAEDLRVYPNPAKDVLYIDNLPKSTYVRITDVQGRTTMLRSEKELNNGLDISELREGIYFLRVEKNNIMVKTMKIVVGRSK